MLDLDATDDPLHGIRKAGSSTATTTATAICRSTSSAAGICWRPSCGVEHRRRGRRGRGGGPHRRPDPRALAADAHPAARRQRLLPRGADGVVRGQPAWITCSAWRATSGWSRRSRRAAAGAGARPRRPASRRAGSRTSAIDTARAGAASAASSARPSGRRARPIRASSSPRCTPPTVDARRLYEDVYCARGEMENRIKECQLDLFADRTSAADHARQPAAAVVRLVGLCAAVRAAPHRPGAAPSSPSATCGTIRLQLLKIGALVRISVRRVMLAMASACPWQHEFALAHAALRRPPPDTNQTAHRQYIPAPTLPQRRRWRGFGQMPPDRDRPACQIGLVTEPRASSSASGTP